MSVKQDFVRDAMRSVTALLYQLDQMRALRREADALNYGGDGLTDADMEGMAQAPTKQDLVDAFVAVDAVNATVDQHRAALYALKRRM
jgi:hypothetical protein